MAGRKGRYGYREYRGRSGARPVLIFIVALLAVLLAAGLAFLVFMGDYVKYTDTGMEIDWPWRGEPTPPPIASDPVVIETDPVVVTVEPTPTPTPTPEPQHEPIGAVTVTAAQLQDGTAAGKVAQAGGGALVVEMKAADGRLAWQSVTELAAQLGVNAADGRTAQAVRELAGSGELYLVARVHGFKDPKLANAKIGALLTKGGRRWYDRRGVCWSSPANQQAADYLAALCLELADMGFDEILLDDAGYPWEGEVNVLATGDNRPEDRTAPVSAFLTRLSGALRERGAALSVCAYEELLPGQEVYSGLTAGVLAGSADRVWLDKRVDREHYQEILAAAGLDDPAARIVAPAGSGAGSWYQ